LPRSKGAKRSKRLAAIDIGTNSIHLIVTDVDLRTGKFRILDREKEIVRLGSDSSNMQILSPGAMKRGIEAVTRFRNIADAAGARIRAVATSAVREARNRNEFIGRVARKTGLRIEVASGIEEARLTYLGVLQALPVFRKKIFLVDIGGGSTEFLIGKERDILYVNSLRIGALRLTQRFFESGKVTKDAVAECREYVAGMLSPVARDVRRMSCELVVGTSGTISSIAAAIRASQENTSEQLNGFSFSARDLGDIENEILKARNNRERASIKGIDPRRAEIIAAGSIILGEIVRALNIKRLMVSEYAFREGIIRDAVEKNYRELTLPLHDIRYQSIIHLAENFHYEKKHAHHVTHLALRLFDQTKGLHRLGKREREFLEAAAILHEIGLYLSHVQHHQHSYYLIRNAELLGFTENDKEIIANIARYHRKSHPKPRHEHFDGLAPDDQLVVQKLAGILRVADGLDRGHSSRVGEVVCRKWKKNLICRLRGARRGGLELERWGADRKKQLFEEALGVRLKLSAG
jgi:exopolyphosphatase/guanosine-5'-triphosphate,3'-diphosphate pyrophosphatase